MVLQEQQALPMAPAVTLKANGHGRALTFNALGTTTLLVCVARETSDRSSPVVTAVRDRYADASQVLIVSIADTRPFPKLLRKVAEQIMKSSYKHAVENLKPGHAPEDYVLIVPDWDGEVLNPLGIGDVSKEIAVAVITRDGHVAGVYQGDDPIAHALTLLEQANA
ncbi:MAG: hypothetical protein WEC75_09235 [Dehalococcoidia bacterium]